MIGFWVNFGVEQHIAPSKKQYMIPFAIQLIPGGILLFGVFFLTESPRWVARVKGETAALEVLSQLRQLPKEHAIVREEAALMMAQIEEETSVRRGGLVGEFQELFGERLNRKKMLYGVLIFVFMQFAGSNAINVCFKCGTDLALANWNSITRLGFSVRSACKAQVLHSFQQEFTGP